LVRIFWDGLCDSKATTCELMPAQYVKPYVKTNKSDYIDAEAVAEAVQRPTMRFVPIKTEEQLDLQAVHRVRERWVMRRTAVVNQIRGLLLQRGLTLPKGRSHVDQALPDILEDAAPPLSGSFRSLLAQLKSELDQLTACVEEMDSVAAIGNGSAFRRGRDLAAWVGMVPREYSTGGKQKLLGISKRGNHYLRRLFVQGARAVLRCRTRQAPGLNSWLRQLIERRHPHVVVVALANKLLHIAWAVLCKNQTDRYAPLAIELTTP
jgi:transposase